MANKLTIGPRCPNHSIGLLRTSDPGIGICPISNARFAFDEQQALKTKKLQLTSLGGMEEVADWSVKNIDGKDN
jgi:hypothetical protein